jgi:hypothetical protein
MNELESLVGKLVKIIYDDGGEVRIRKGRITSVGDDFLKFQTRSNSYVIGKRAITSIKAMEGG